MAKLMEETKAKVDNDTLINEIIAILQVKDSLFKSANQASLSEYVSQVVEGLQVQGMLSNRVIKDTFATVKFSHQIKEGFVTHVTPNLERFSNTMYQYLQQDKFFQSYDNQQALKLVISQQVIHFYLNKGKSFNDIASLFKQPQFLGMIKENMPISQEQRYQGFIEQAGEAEIKEIEEKCFKRLLDKKKESLREQFKSHKNCEEIVAKKSASEEVQAEIWENAKKLTKQHIDINIPPTKALELIQQNPLFVPFTKGLTLFDIVLKKVATGEYDESYIEQVKAQALISKADMLMVKNVASFIKEAYFDGDLNIAEEMNLTIWQEIFTKHPERAKLITTVKGLFTNKHIPLKGWQFFADVNLSPNEQDGVGKTLLHTLFDLINNTYDQGTAEHLLCRKFIRKLVSQPESSEEEETAGKYVGADPTIQSYPIETENGNISPNAAPLHLMTLALRAGKFSLQDAKLVLEAAKASGGDLYVICTTKKDDVVNHRTFLDYLKKFSGEAEDEAIKNTLDELADIATEEYGAKAYAEMSELHKAVDALYEVLVKAYGQEDGHKKFLDLAKNPMFFQEQALCEAINKLDIDTFKKILQSGFSPDAKLVTKGGITLKDLVRAEQEWQIPVEKDGQVGFYVGSFDSFPPHGDGRTLMHIAAEEHDFAYAKLLIEAGFSENLVDNWGLTPIHHAFARILVSSIMSSEVDEQKQETNQLLEYLKDKFPYIAAIEIELREAKEQKWHLDDLDELLEIFNPNQKEASGLSILMIAASFGHYDVTKKLLECDKVDTNVADDGDENNIFSSALYHAFQAKQHHIIKLFLEKGISVDKPDNGSVFFDYICNFAAQPGYGEFIFNLLRDEDIIEMVKYNADLTPLGKYHPLISGIIASVNEEIPENTRAVLKTILELAVDNYEFDLNSYTIEPSTAKPSQDDSSKPDMTTCKTMPMLSLFAKYAALRESIGYAFEVLLNLGASPLEAIKGAPQLQEEIIGLCKKYLKPYKMTLLEQDVMDWQVELKDQQEKDELQKLGRELESSSLTEGAEESVSMSVDENLVTNEAKDYEMGLSGNNGHDDGLA